MSFSTRIYTVLSVLAFTVLANQALASDTNDAFATNSQLKKHTWIDDIKWHGFASQNFVATDENNFMGSSSDGSFKSNELALNASWRANESLQFALQGLYKQVGSAQPKGTRIDYAIVDWRLLDTFSTGAGIRAGRIKNPYGFFNETRDVAVTNLSILLPESIYIDYLSQVMHSFDGIGFYAHNETDKGTFTFNGQLGRPIITDQMARTMTNDPNTNGKISEQKAYSTRVAYEDGAGIWRAYLSYIHFEAEFTPSSMDPAYLTAGDISTDQLLLSLELNLGKWQFLSEIQRRDTEAKNITTFNPKVNEKGLGYYFQTTYSITPTLKTYFRHDVEYRFKDDKDGSKFIEDLKAINPLTETKAYKAFTKDTTFGFRYSPSFEWSYAMEMHVIDGTSWLPTIENPNESSQKRYWNMFLAQVAYRF